MFYNSPLITGCGGDIALAIARILRESQDSMILVGTDISDDHPGFAFYDYCETIPKVTDPNYLSVLKEIIINHKIDVIIPMSEPEIRFFTNHEIDKIDGVPIVMASFDARKIGFDKYETAMFLKDNGFPYPWTVLVAEGPPVNVPCIIKDRTGSGNRDVKIVEHELVNYYSKTRRDAVWQERLLPDDKEYTCGVYRTGQGETRCIIFRRWLVGGHTGKAVTENNKEIETLLKMLAEIINLKGSINVQLRLTSKGPVIFEINPRFSSTVYFRHMLGFCDLLWSLHELSSQPLTTFKPIKSGLRIYRVSNEICNVQSTIKQHISKSKHIKIGG
jgi:carbamoyl-phosphate synthase large subunit